MITILCTGETLSSFSSPVTSPQAQPCFLPRNLQGGQTSSAMFTPGHFASSTGHAAASERNQALRGRRGCGERPTAASGFPHRARPRSSAGASLSRAGGAAPREGGAPRRARIWPGTRVVSGSVRAGGRRRPGRGGTSRCGHRSARGPWEEQLWTSTICTHRRGAP